MSTEESDDQRADDLVRKQDADRALEYASLGRRLVAFALDFAASILAVMVPVWIIMRLLLAAGVWTPVFPDSSGETTWLVMGIGPRVLVVIAFYLSTGPLYFVLCESSAWQATIGKRFLGIYVTDYEGKRIGIPRSAGRLFARQALEWFGLAIISLITILAGEKRQGLHDLVAKNFVLRGRPTPNGSLEQ